MTFYEFIKKWDGKFIDYDQIYGAQCVDLIKEYFQDVLGQKPITGDAITYWKDLPGFTRIKNTIFNYPQQGDIIILNTGLYGHISICNSANLFTYTCFEQNNPLNSPCHLQTHGYKSVLGWLRPNPANLVVNIAYIGPQNALGDDFKAKLVLYSQNRISCVLGQYQANISVPTGMLGQDESYALADQVNPSEKFIIMFYLPNPTATFFSTYYYPKRNCMITTAPVIDSRLLVFELSHQLQMWYNENRKNNPYTEVVDSNFPTDDLIRSKLQSILPYISIFPK